MTKANDLKDADEAVTTPRLRRRRDDDTGRHVLWGIVLPRAGESVRWARADGAWVAISLGSGDEMGLAIVQDWTGRRSAVDSYEDALSLARSWRSS